MKGFCLIAEVRKIGKITGRESKMSKYRKLTLSVATLTAFFFFYGAAANSAWQEEWDRAVQAAKKEGQQGKQNGGYSCHFQVEA